MLFSYGYGWWKNWRWWTSVPHLMAISIALRRRGCNAMCSAWCSMSRAIPEAYGRRHRATDCSVLPRQPPGQQANKQQWKNTPTLLAVSMAVAMCWYATMLITQWRGSRASLEATGRRHRASTCSDNIKGTCLSCFLYFSPSSCLKRLWGKRMAPINNRGVTYQTDGKHLTSLIEYFVGGG